MKHSTPAIAITALLIILTASAGAQQEQHWWGEQQTQRWWLGALGGGTYVRLQGAIHTLDDTYHDVAQPHGFEQGGGTNLLAGVTLEYAITDHLGASIGVIYDDRSITAVDNRLDDSGSAEGNAIELVTRMAYISIEPNVRLDLGSGFAILAGPSVGFNIARSYDYTYLRPAPVSGTRNDPVTGHGTLRAARPLLFGGQLLLRYDIMLAGSREKPRLVLAPFLGVTMHTELFKNDEVNSYLVNTLRYGVELRLGMGR